MKDTGRKFHIGGLMTATEIARELAQYHNECEHDPTEAEVQEILEVLTPELCEEFMDTIIAAQDNDTVAEVVEEYQQEVNGKILALLD